MKSVGLSRNLGNETPPGPLSGSNKYPGRGVSQVNSTIPCHNLRADLTFSTPLEMDSGYARITTPKQELARQIDALTKAGINPRRTSTRTRSPGATTERPGLQALLGYTREGDVIVVNTLDRPGPDRSPPGEANAPASRPIATRGRSTASEPSWHE